MRRLALAPLCLAALPATAQDFPLTLETRFGDTVIETAPERVATVDYAGVDNVLALGFQPLTARGWFGPYEDALWPWADALATESPVVIGGQIDYEAIAATDPDVILALRSGITEDDFTRLSAIAPVVAVPPGQGDYDLDWRQQAELAGRALGRSDEAAAQIAEVEDKIAATRAAHPGWEGRTFAVFTHYAGSIGLYTATDSSVRFIESLGLTVHPKVAELSEPGQFYVEISEEILPEMDADLIVWFSPPDSPEVNALAARGAMKATAEGREIFLALDSLTNGALSHGSLLSLPDAVDRLEPMIEAALDGDPATEVTDELATAE